MRHRILILGDHNWRDTPSLALIQVQIERLLPDADVRIIDTHLCAPVAEMYHPHVVIVNNLHDPDKNKIFDQIRRRGGLIVVKNEEGRPNNDGLMKWSTQTWPTELCDLCLCWSQEYANNLPAGVKLAVTGGARFDFYHSPYKSLVSSRKEVCSLYGLDSSEMVVTVASSFPQAKFSKYGTADFLKKDWKKLKRDTVPGAEDPTKAAQQEREALVRFQAWLRVLKAEHPEIQLLVKPHPADDIRDWRGFCDETDAKLMLMDYVFNLFAASDLHISRLDCMTGPESWMADVPNIMCDLRMDKTAEAGGAVSEIPEWGRIAYSSTDLLGMFNVWQRMENKSPAYSTQDWEYLDKWVGPRKNAAQSIAHAIHLLLEERQPNTYKEPEVQDWINLHGLLAEHSNQTATPVADHIGQFAKAVRLEDTNRWVQRISKLWQ